jgi:hypothetical protein
MPVIHSVKAPAHDVAERGTAMVDGQFVCCSHSGGLVAAGVTKTVQPVTAAPSPASGGITVAGTRAVRDFDNGTVRR